MTDKMPRGAIRTPRSELASSEPYEPEADVEKFVPSGEIPTPNHELAAAQPFRAAGVAPGHFLAWPIRMGLWGNEKVGSTWAEEAFAKACADPPVFIPTDVVLLTSQECGSSNFATFMRTRGFRIGRTTYLNGPFNSVEWTNAMALNGAIASARSVKVGVASANLGCGPHGQVTPGVSGWAIYGLPTGEAENYCASLCGYGPLAKLVELFNRHEVNVNLPTGMPTGLCYAMFTWGSIGIIDRQSLMNITGEAWARNPTTIVKNLSGSRDGAH
jgi:hypothetical protein